MKLIASVALCAAALLSSACKGPSFTEESAAELINEVMARVDAASAQMGSGMVSRQLQTWTEGGVVYSQTIHAPTGEELDKYPSPSAEVVPLRHKITGGRLAPVITTTLGDRAAVDLIKREITMGAEPVEIVTQIGFAGRAGAKADLRTARMKFPASDFALTLEPLHATYTESGLTKGGRIKVKQGGLIATRGEGESVTVGGVTAVMSYGATVESKISTEASQIKASLRGINSSAERLGFKASSTSVTGGIGDSTFALGATGLSSSHAGFQSFSAEPITVSFDAATQNLPMSALRQAAIGLHTRDHASFNELNTAIREMVSEMRASATVSVGNAPTHYEASLSVTLPPPTTELADDGDVLIHTVQNAILEARAEIPSSIRDLVPAFNIDGLIESGIAAESAGRIRAEMTYRNNQIMSRDGKVYDPGEMARLAGGE